MEQYPYVALYKVLLAKKYIEDKNNNYQEALQQAAISAPNRNRLYHYINVDKQSKDKKEVVTEPVKVETVDINPKEILIEEIETNEKAVEISVGIETDSNKAEAIKENDVVENEEHSFVEWLSFLDGDEVVADPEDELESELKRNIVSAEYEVGLNKEIANLEAKSEASKVELTKHEKEAVDQLATGSITLTTGVVTETLAKIMLMQGKINDAIAMYQALSLKYPEKSNYFAAQIEKIKKN